MTENTIDTPVNTPHWGKIIDHTRCIGCHACTTACKSENEVPLSVTRTYVKYVDVGVFPQARRAFQVTRCNQCDDPPCVTACPTSAMYRRHDGIVDFDKSRCIGCKACIAACPYDAIFINPDDYAAEKCNFCAHRLDMGLEPACVVVCPTEAILVGDLNDPGSKVAQTVKRDAVTVRRPEKETRPKLFYKGAHQATLDPLAAARPEGGLFMWSEQEHGPGAVLPGHPTLANTSAAAMLAYDIPHQAPWDWRVSLYTWTKGIASGVYLAGILATLVGVATTNGVLWQWVIPIVAAAFLAFTGALLIWDLEHPERFYYIFTKPQWRSWLVRGAVIIGGFGTVLGMHLLSSALQINALYPVLVALGIPLSVLTAVYTAYLFAQAKARDLWQNPLLPPHFLVKAVIAGSATLLPLTVIVEPNAVAWFQGVLTAGCIVHLLLVLGETTLTHPTAHARLAAEEMRSGRYRQYFWSGVVFALVGATPWVGIVAAPIALAGILMHEHAYVQAGQSVPLA